MTSRNLSYEFKQSVAQHLRSIADWRRWRAQDVDRDPRNHVSAEALDELADYVLTLADDNEALIALYRYATENGQFAPGQQTNYAIARFHFFNTDSEFDPFLEHLAELAWEDLDEQGKFGGKNLPPEDDPWS